MLTERINDDDDEGAAWGLLGLKHEEIWCSLAKFNNTFNLCLSEFNNLFLQAWQRLFAAL